MPLEHPCSYRECTDEQGIILGIMILIMILVAWYLDRRLNRRKKKVKE